jgi:hypothetical protein
MLSNQVTLPNQIKMIMSSPSRCLRSSALRRGYHTLLGKPVDYVPSNIAVYSYLEMVEYLPMEVGLGWNATMFVSGALARLSLLPIKWVLGK